MGYGVKIVHPIAPNYVTRSPGCVVQLFCTEFKLKEAELSGSCNNKKCTCSYIKSLIFEFLALCY